MCSLLQLLGAHLWKPQQVRCTLSTVENGRWALYARVREVLGEREGDILMEHLPPSAWSNLATKEDLALTRADLRREMSELRVDMSELRVDMSELRVDMEKGFRSQNWKMVTAMCASQAVSVAIMAAMVNSLR